jgi:hypothetical protein
MLIQPKFRTEIPAALKPQAKVLQKREQWLAAIALELEGLIKSKGYTDIPLYRVGVGFTGSGKKVKEEGECWDMSLTKDKYYEIIINITQVDTLKVAGILGHEMCHIVVGIPERHKQKFAKLGRAIGFEGQPKYMGSGAAFTEWMKPMIEKYGEYPHGGMNFGDPMRSSHGRPKQINRMLKVHCPPDAGGCDYIVRMSKACIEIGIPGCPNEDCERYYLLPTNIKKGVRMVYVP